MRLAPASLVIALTCLAGAASMAASQDAPSPPAQPEMPHLLPGYYNQTITIQRIDVSRLSTKMGGPFASGRTLPPMSEQACYTGDELFRASEFFPGNPDLDEACREVSTSLAGTRGEGEIICALPGGHLAMHYEGDFTDTSQRVTLSMKMRSKTREGELTFKATVALERIAETCTEDIPQTEEAAAEAEYQRDLREAMKK